MKSPASGQSLTVTVYGPRAVVIRNEQMLDTGVDLVIAFWDGQSRGTQHMIESAKRRGIPVEIIGSSGGELHLARDAD